MPRFLEQALRHEASKKGLKGKAADRYVFGSMNNLGAVKGNVETAKGREMEKKHMADKKEEKKSPFHKTEIMHHSDGSHTVEHFPHMKGSSSGAFVERGEPTSYAATSGKHLMEKLHEHLGVGAAKAAGTPEAEMHSTEPKGEAEMEEEGE